MKIKKLIALLAALCMAIGTMSLMACGDKGGNNNGNESSSVSSEEELPLGSEGNPYRCFYEVDYDTGEIVGDSMHIYFNDAICLPTAKANSVEYFEIAKAGDKTIIIDQADVTIVYNGTSYSAKDGAIEIQAKPTIAGDHRESAIFQIINETDADIELIIQFKEMDEETGEGETSEVNSGEVIE